MKVLKHPRSNYEKRIVKRYSESFKLQVLDELSQGAVTKNELKRKYNLGGQTIEKWILKYNRQDLLNRKIVIQMPEEISQIKQLQKRITELEKALVEKDLNELCTNGLLEVAAQQLGYKDREELKKKLDNKVSKRL